ncbi:MAG TPA: PLP-dependent aminotransferase family protein [Verrucomicrobiae bacterium]|jgi:DNA-binding transcriptional MocR family regulator|nr:PLP-dependent aminotransferase family protein [Verrucomicrobiae bacterium]
MRANLPIYEQLAGQLGEMIQTRSLRAGDRMPSVRKFSVQQRVSVPTALKAYVTLETRGLIEARPKSGFYVRARRIDLTPEPMPSPTMPKVIAVGNFDPVRALLSDHANSKLVPLGAALPSAELLPGVKLTRTMAMIGRRLGANSIDYDMAPGHETLRRELARRSLEWGCALKADDFIVTVGGTEALSLALRATCKPGDTVVVESPTYFGLPGMLRELQLKALPIPVHGSEGIDLDLLQKSLRKTRVGACVLIPNIHNPIGFIMPDERKRQLIEICAERKIPVIEDDTYGDLQHEGARPRCLKAFDPEGFVLLCGSYSKRLAPGYRVGYIAAGKWQTRVLAQKQASTLNGALLPTLTVAEFLKNGGYDRYLRSVRQAYHNQVAKMREAIAEHFPKGVGLSRPKGGYLLWCELPKSVDAFKLSKQAREAGISIAPGPLFSAADDFQNFIRVNCGYPWNPAMERAVRTLGQLVRKQLS